jgi:hypothetical protein
MKADRKQLGTYSRLIFCKIKTSLIAFSLISCIGCFGAYTFAPVASMSDYQLQDEYSVAQDKLEKKEVDLYDLEIYCLGTYLKDVSLKSDIYKLRSRISELNTEMTKRELIPWNIKATPPQTTYHP